MQGLLHREREAARRGALADQALAEHRLGIRQEASVDQDGALAGPSHDRPVGLKDGEAAGQLVSLGGRDLLHDRPPVHAAPGDRGAVGRPDRT